MPVAVHITARKMSHEDRQKVLGDFLDPDTADPDGRQYHAAYGDGDELRMFEVWDSEDQFSAHYEDQFGRMLAATYGITYEVHPLHGERRPD
jgi:hypothetical protein